MTLDYQKVWETMNSLETTICKVISVRQVIDSAVESLERGDREKAENLMNAAYDFIGYFVDDFDSKFKEAWNETVVKLKNEQLSFDGFSKNTSKVCDKDNTSPECKQSWADFWEENYYPEEYDRVIKEREYYEPSMPPWGHSDMEYLSQQKEDKVVKWRLPVEMDPSGEYFIQFPDDLLDAAGLKEGDKVEWVDFLNGTFILRKTTEPLGSDEC